jgi:uncharacterized protein (DUF305 family)
MCTITRCDESRHVRGRLLRRGAMALVVAALGTTGLIAAAQIQPMAAQFMRVMSGSMERMDRQMATAPMNGNADHDFASMMIPHHEGAIGMAKAELIYGKNPVMRRLAQEILVDQQSEIDAMQLWLEKTTTGNPPKEK